MPLDQNIPVCYTAIDIKRTARGPDIKFFKKVGSAINSRAFAYTSFVLSVCAAVFLSSATWTYGWIADIYPLGDKFVPTLLGVICACAAVNLIYLLICAFAGDKKDSLKGIKAINVIHTIFALLSGAGGVMVFRVGCDGLIDNQNSVTGGIEDTLNRYVTGW